LPREISQLSVTRWSQLESLSLQESGLHGIQIGLPALRQLTLAGSKALVNLELSCRALRSLSLASCVQLARMSAEGSAAIEDLNLSMCRKLDSRAVTQLVSQCADSLLRANCNGLTTVREEPEWLRSTRDFREHVGAQLQFVDLRGSCAAGGEDALFLGRRNAAGQSGG